MSDHPVIVPTSVGPVGGMVSAPDGPRRGAVVMVQGAARGGRAGMDAIWTKIGHRLAELGLVVLRFDFSNDGDSTMLGVGGIESGVKVKLDHRIFDESIRWLRERTDGDLFLVGSCYGGRLAVEFAQHHPDVAASFVIVPYLGRPDNRLPGWRGLLWTIHRTLRSSRLSARLRYSEPVDPDVLDPDLIEMCRASDAGRPCWILAGEPEAEPSRMLQRLLGPKGAALELEIVPGGPLYPVYAPDRRELVTDRLIARVVRALALPSPVAAAEPAGSSSRPR